jgi:putative DNA primase/helicase
VTWGGAVRLCPVSPEIVIGEGIESSASAGLLLGLPAWAALSATNLERGLVLPAAVRSIIIGADHDFMTRRGRRPGQEAAAIAAGRWRREGRRAHIATPDKPGLDFNDLLQERRHVS